MIRFRLIVWNAIVFAVTLSVIGAVVFVSTKAELSRGVDEDLTKRALYLEQSWRRLPGERPPPLPPPSTFTSAARLLDPIQARRVEFIAHLAIPRIFTVDGKSMGPKEDPPFDRKSLADGFSGKRGFVTIAIDGRRVRILTVPLTHAGHVTEAAEFATDLEGVDSGVSNLKSVLLTSVPVALLITCLLGYWLTIRALRPVTEIADAAERIEAVSLSGRLPVSGHDEFAHLASRFNSMLARLEQSFGQLEQTNQAQRRFIADASHELKTPLTTVKGRVGVALVGPQTVERYSDHVHAIGRAADGMSAIVRDLLMLAQSDEGKLIVRKEPTSLAEMVGEANLMANDSDLDRVEMDVANSLLIDADPGLLKRALSNLIANAIRHTPSPGTVIVRAANVDGQVRIDVIDDGEGIPACHVPHLFDRFHRVDGSRDRESGGTGLGLSIVRSIIEAHEGRIEITSRVGLGTRVSLFLPCNQRAV